MTHQRRDLSTQDVADAAASREAAAADDRRRAAVARKDQPASTDRDRPVSADDEPRAALFVKEEAEGYRSRWEAIQTGFVDEPRTAVQEADALVAQVVTRLADVFNTERTALEQQWDRGDNISTEDLRVALKRYRSFFDRLLSV